MISSSSLAANLGHDSSSQDRVLAILDRRWPLEHSIRLGPPYTIFGFYPFLFKELFSNVSNTDLERLSLGCRLLASSVVASDDLVDGDSSIELAADVVIKCQALTFEAMIAFSETGNSTSFLGEVKSLFASFAHAIVLQRHFMSGRLSLSTLNVQVGQSIAVNKTALAFSAVLGLNDLSGQPADLISVLQKAIYNFNLARQYYDDLCDWRNDLCSRRPSLIVSELAQLCTEDIDRPEWRGSREPALKVYYTGVIDRIRGYIFASLDDKDVTYVASKCNGFGFVVKSLKNAATKLFEDLHAIKNRDRELI